MAALIRRENCQPNKFPFGVLLVQMKRVIVLELSQGADVLVLCISNWCQDVKLQRQVCVFVCAIQATHPQREEG
jgi:hypothetical protein